MSEEKIDSLDIQIETSLGSDTAKQISKASSAIKRMAENLKDVDTSRLEKLNSLFKGTKELESYAQSIKTVSSSIKSLSKIDKSSLDGVKSTLKEISDMKLDFSQFKDLQNIDFSGLKKYSSQLDSIKKSAGKMDTVIPGTPAEKDPLVTLNGVTRLTSEWDAFFAKENQNANDFRKTVSGMGDSRKVFYTDGEYQKYDTKKTSQWVNADAEKSDKASQKAKEAQENWKKFTAGLEKIITPKINTDSLKQIEKEIASTSARYEKLTTDFRNRQLLGESIKSEPMKHLQVEIAKAEKMLDEMKAKYSELSSKAIMHEQGRVKNAGTPVINSKDIDKLQFDLAKAQQKLRDLIAEKDRLKSSSVGFNTSQLLENATAINATKQQIQALQSRIDDVNAGKLGKISTFSGIAKGALSKLTGALKLLGKGLKWVGGKALNLGKSLFASKTGANGLSGSLNGGYKAFLRYGLGIRSTFALLNKLRSSFGNAMNNLVRYSSTTNRAVSSMWNSLNALKNSLATAFAPVINSVAPYVSALIDMLTDAMNTIAQFFAAITGSKTVVVAKKQNKNYAASIGNIGSAAGGSADKVKDLADALDLLDFDEINKLSDNTSNKGSGGSGGGSGSGGSGVAGMFETETVDSAFKDLADLFKNGDWDAIGDIIANGINSAVGKLDAAISWDNVGDKITNICNGITSIFNRVVDKMDWSMLGKTVGDGVNTVLYTINLLYDGVDWENLGSKVATAVNSIFTTVDWDAVGAFLVQKFNAVWEFGAGFFGNLDGKSIGEDIGTALNSAMKHLNLNAAKSSLTGALNTLSDIIGGFNKKVDWKSLTTKLSDAVKGMITGVKWDELGANLGELMGNLVKTLVTIVTDTDTLGALIKGGSDLILGFFDGILTAIGGDMWTKVKKAVKGVNDWLNESGNKNIGNMVLSGITFDFEMNQETRDNFAGFIGKINSESVELKVDTKLLQSGDDAWRDYAKKWNEQKPELKIPDSVINGGKSEIIKWLADAYAQDPTLSVGVETEKTGAETVNEFDKSADRVGGAHIDVNPRKPAKETAQDFANEVNASGAKASIDVEGKLKDKLDTSKIGNITVDAGVKATGIDPNGKTLLAPFSASDMYNNGKSMYSGFYASDMSNNGKSMFSTFKASSMNNNDKSMFSTFKASSMNENGKAMYATFKADSLKPDGHSMKGEYTATDINAQKGISVKGTVKAKNDISKKTNGKNINAVAAEVKVKKVKGVSGAINKFLNMIGIKEKGGVYSNGSWSNLPQFAGGGIITSQKIGRFAGGGLPMHGTMFAAGERGAEIVGNINGRTEVLNQSQIASAIYAAMIQAMKQQNVSVDVSLQGDANTMFKVVQKKARQYTVQTGKMPFAY